MPKLSEKLAGEQLIKLCFKLRQENDKLKLELENLRLTLIKSTLENQTLRGDCFSLASQLPTQFVLYRGEG